VQLLLEKGAPADSLIPLKIAAQAGHKGIANQLLKACSDKFRRRTNGKLIEAAILGDIEQVKNMIAAGWPVVEKTDNGEMSCYAVCKFHYSYGELLLYTVAKNTYVSRNTREEIIRLLVKHGANIKLAMSTAKERSYNAYTILRDITDSMNSEQRRPCSANLSDISITAGAYKTDQHETRKEVIP